MEQKANEGKNLTVEVDGIRYARLPIRTHVITAGDNIVDVARRYAGPHLQPGNVLFITEKVVACTQGRAIPMTDIHPRKLACFLSSHVTKTPHGIGLGIPQTMECALQEVGTGRILMAAGISVIGKKIFHKNGWFYKVAGYRATSIDGPCPNTIPPYNSCVVLGPLNPDQVAREIQKELGCPVVITDINDLDGQILGTSSPTLDKSHYIRILKDNPLGQDCQQTPMGIIRKLD